MKLTHIALAVILTAALAACGTRIHAPQAGTVKVESKEAHVMCTEVAQSEEVAKLTAEARVLEARAKLLRQESAHKWGW